MGFHASCLPGHGACELTHASFFNLLKMIRSKTSDAALQIVVTTTATSLKDLLDTANSGALNLRTNLDAVLLNAEDGDIRISASGVPSLTKGLIIAQGQTRIEEGVNFADFFLIASVNTKVNVDIGRSKS